MIRQSRKPTLHCLIAALLVMTPQVVLAIDPSKYSIDMIRKAWGAREEQVRSLKISWTTKRVFRKTYRSARRWHGDPNTPGEFATANYNDLVHIDGDKVDYRSESLDGARHNEGLYFRHSYNGRISQSFGRTSDGGNGVINAEAYRFTGHSIMLLPIYCPFQPLRADMGAFELDGTVITRDPGALPEGGECVILRRRVDDVNHHELWVDPELQFLPRRWLTVHSGKPHVQLDIFYQQDPKIGPVPSLWKMTWLESDLVRLNDSTESKVVEYEINPEIAASEFTIDYPTGTGVLNEINNTRYIVGTDDGPPLTGWLLLISLVGVVGFIVILVRRRRKKEASGKLVSP